MGNSSKIAVALGGLLVIVLIGVGIGWFASRGPAVEPQPRVQSEPTLTARPTSEPAPRNTSTERQPPPSTNRIVRTQNPVTPDFQITTPEPVTWEDKLDDILASDDDDTNKVNQLFAMYPTLDKDGKEEVAQHLSNLVEDEQYGPLAEILLDPTQPADVLDLLFADVLNRANTIKLPMFLGMARTPTHPNREEALELLELFLDEEYGENWTAWQRKMEEWLKENPD